MPTLPFTIPRWAWGLIGGIVAVLLLWWALDSYGDRRYNAGVTDTDAKWQEAADKLKEEAAASATRADDKAVERLEQFEQQAEDDRKAVQDAIEEGSSPLDALFGG